MMVAVTEPQSLKLGSLFATSVLAGSDEPPAGQWWCSERCESNAVIGLQLVA